jgi:hypothetical protein
VEDFSMSRSSSFVRRIFSVLALVSLFIVASAGFTPALAADITWGGNYRIEAVKIKNPELSPADSNKSYLLNHLTLNPKIVAADGLTIYSRLDILNNRVSGISPTGAIYSVAGDFLGQGPNSEMTGQSSATAATGQDSNAWSRTQRAGDIAITSLYMSWAQEFGQLVVGRVPMQFGLGTAFNAGTNVFDHYIDTKDMVAYKVVFGNLFVMPMLGKVSEGMVGDEDDINDYVLQVQYDNPETELSLGAIYQMRIGTHAGNDVPTNQNAGGGNTNIPTSIGRRADGFKNTLISLFSTQKVGDFRIGLEADLLSGDTGLATADGRGISLNSYGGAFELGWNPADRKYSALLKAGIASGDDPGTADAYEGFAFNRNYETGLLMFNHPLGQADFMRTGMNRGVPSSATAPAPAYNVRNEIDTEAISNAIYLAPSFQYRQRDNLSYGATVVYGMLNKEPIAGGSTSRQLGYELDLNVSYKPIERLTWITEAGVLFPGEAWKGSGSSVFETKFSYGVVTKAAINF